METVWAVENGRYSDYHVVGVFSTRAGAELCATQSSGARVTEWPLDPAVGHLYAGRSRYHVMMYPNGDTERVVKTGFDTDPDRVWNTYAGFRGDVWATDEQHAVKIVNEKRIEMLVRESA